MTVVVWTYVAYLVICVGITIWVGEILRKYGRVVLSNGLEGSHELTDAFAHLLIVGFYLINLGVISFNLKIGGQVSDAQTAIELVSLKIGTILVVLGAMHFLIFAALAKTRSSADQQRAEQERRAMLREQRRQNTEPVFEQ